MPIKEKILHIITHPIFFYAVIMLATILSFYASYYYNENEYLKALFNNVATGLFAAAFISFLFERLNRKNQEKYLASIEKTQAFNLLSTLIPTQIFNEINKFIIEEKFLRFSCRGIVELKHLSGYPDYLIMNDRYEFIVQNLRHSLEVYELYVFEDWIFSIDGVSTKIIDVILREEDSSGHFIFKESYDWNQLKTEGSIIFNLPEKRIELFKNFKIKAKQKIKLIIRTQSIRETKDFFPYIMTEPTTDLSVEFTYPNDLDVSAFPLHPNLERFDTIEEDTTKRIWSIDSGILPYQGIQISWTSKSNSQYSVVNNLMNETNCQSHTNFFTRVLEKIFQYLKRLISS